MNLIYTRHGQTDWNTKKWFQGTTDIELNEKGIEQAKEVAEKLKKEHIDVIISSPLKRASKTAQIINKDRDIPIIYDERITERCFGVWEGKQPTEEEFNTLWNYDKNIYIENGENIREFFDRIYNCLDDIKLKYKDKNVLIVAHGAVSVPVRYYFENLKPEGTCKGILLNNCEYVKFNV